MDFLMFPVTGYLAAERDARVMVTWLWDSKDPLAMRLTFYAVDRPEKHPVSRTVGRAVVWEGLHAPAEDPASLPPGFRACTNFSKDEFAMVVRMQDEDLEVVMSLTPLVSFLAKTYEIVPEADELLAYEPELDEELHQLLDGNA